MTVDPNICITKAKLPLVEIALRHIDNPDVKKLIHAIISEIERDGVATSKDIQQIENKLGIFFPIYMGRIWSYGLVIDNWHCVFAFPGELICSTTLFTNDLFAFFAAWNCEDPYGHTEIKNIFGQIKYSKDGLNSGVILGFLGVISFPYPLMHNPGYSINGRGALIIITS